MKKKVLACFLAISLICTSGGIAWAEAEGQTEVFDTESLTSDSESNESAAMEAVSSQGNDEILMDRETYQDEEAVLDFSDGMNEEQETGAFTSEEPEEEIMLFSSGDTDDTRVLEIGGEITVQPGSEGTDSFTLKISEEGIYQLSYSSPFLIEIPGHYGSHEPQKFIVRLNEDTYTVNCKDIQGATTVTATQLPDIEKLEIVNSDIPTYYKGESVTELNTTLKITDINGNETITDNSGCSEIYGYCNWRTDSDNKMYISIACAPAVETDPIQLNYKEITESDPTSIDIDNNVHTISKTDANNYCFQFKTSAEGIYKIKFEDTNEFSNIFYVRVYEISDSEENKIVPDPVFNQSVSNEARFSLAANSRYLVRISSSDPTETLSFRLNSAKMLQSFTLTNGQTMPSEMIDLYTKLLPDTKFVITYTDETSDTITYKEGSQEYGRITSTEINGHIVYYLANDNDWGSPGHSVQGPKLVDFDTASYMTEIKLNSVNTIPLSEAYLDGAYFKFQAPEEGVYDFTIKNAKTVASSHGTQESDEDIIFSPNLKQNETIYFIAKNLTADAVEVEIEKKPLIKSISLKRGNIEGKSFIADILYDDGFSNVAKDCLFEVTYSDGTPSEIISTSWSKPSKYYGHLEIYTDAYDDGSILTGDQKVWAGFDKSEVTSPKYTIHIVDKPDLSQITNLGINQEKTLTKGIHDLQWFSFTAPENGTYIFQVKTKDNDELDSFDYYWAKENVKSNRSSQNLQWNYAWRMLPEKLQQGEIFHVGVSSEETLKVKATAVGEIRKIELPPGQNLSKTYIKEFLMEYAPLPVVFNVIFSDNISIPVECGDPIYRDGINYGYLNYDWPVDEDSNYTSGILTVHINNSYIEGRDFVKSVNVISLSELNNLPELSLDKDIASTAGSNYNNGYCFSYKAEKAGTYEIVFTPNDSAQKYDDEDGKTEQPRIIILKNGKFSEIRIDDATSIIRNFVENERIYFLCRQCNCSVKVQAAQDSNIIKSLLVRPAHTDLLYGDFFNLPGWQFQLEFKDNSTSETLYSINEAFDKYGEIAYKIGGNDGIDADGLRLGDTTVQFYLKDFPDIESEEISISVKKGSDMEFTPLELNSETDWEDTTKYTNQKAAIFTPQKSSVYQYTIKNVYWVNLADDEGNIDSLNPLNSYNGILEGIFQGKADIGYTFLASYDDDPSIKRSIIITEIDKSELQSAYNANKNKSSSGYTTSSWNRFSQALEAAELVLYDNTSLQKEINQALQDLQSAVKGLTYIYYPPSVDKSSLRKLYDTCSAYKETEYTTSSWNGLQEALKSAKNVLETSSSQTAVDQAEKVLKDAIASLVKTADKNALKAAYEKYRSYKKDDYTLTTWTKFEKALSAAEAGINDKDLTKDKVSELLDDLEKAVSELLKVGAPAIKNITVNGNTAVVSLNGTAEKADGYDFVIGNKNCITTKKYVDIRKNILKQQTEFKYIQKGTYYAYCHAWKKVDGKKVFGPWSAPLKFTVTATTPSTPKIKSVSVKGTTVTVTLDKIKGITSYDAILGKSLGKDSSYGNRPLNYGKLVIKTKSNKIVFKNVKKGTYYFGVHAANRTSNNKTKVFSKWTTKKITVK
ncbi:MAG: FIVAR domain-containing protein [Eubacteriales bacterium]|nr:FIVAR domain-containing protein [Eubacteriales bacterium]